MKKLLIIPVILICLAGASPRRTAYSQTNLVIPERPNLSAKVDSLNKSLLELETQLK